MIKVGNMVIPNEATFRVTDLDPLLAVLHVPERQIDKLRVGHAAKFVVDAIEDAEYGGRIERISPVVDPATGTIKVTVEVYDSSRRLKPGMFARVHIVHDTHTCTVLAPRDAIIEEDDKTSVFVVRDSTAYRQSVETGYVNSVHIEVVSGLDEGDTVVTIGKGSLKDSTRVEMVSSEPGGLAGSGDEGEVASGAETETAEGAAASSGVDEEVSTEADVADEPEGGDESTVSDASGTEG
jgi:membrane fusion protein (multidrug efflux system)